jgi:asparagine synthase (glutamine-hydrolysing)
MAYQKWAESCVDHAYGDYAFCVLDRRTGDVVAMVSHSGSARLYYSESNGRLIVAGQLGAIIAHPSVSRDLDIAALGMFMVPKILPGSTPYLNVRSLRGGHALVCRNGDTVKIHRWWRPDCSIRIRYHDSRDYARHADELFAAAVKTRLRSRTGVATTLSGGLDSTLVAAVAATQLRQQGAALTAYTSFPEPGLACAMRAGWDNDDFPYAAAVAAMHDNITHVGVTPGGRCLIDILPAIRARSHTPLRNGANHIWLNAIATSMADRGVRVLLMGEKGNATISASGDGAFRDALLQRQFATSMRLAAIKLRQEGSAALRPIASDLIGPRLCRLIRRGSQEKSKTGEEFLSASFLAGVGEAILPRPPLDGRARFVQFASSGRHSWVADSIAQWGIEYRDPTDDRRLTEVLLSFPLDAFVLEGRNRGLAREMGKGLVPDVVRLRKTRGAQVPEQEAIVAAHARTYREALGLIAGTKLCGAVLNVDHLASALEEIIRNPLGGLEAYRVDRAVDVGLFIADAQQ